MAAKRQKREVVQLSINVATDGVFCAQGQSLAFESLLHHILFMRGQIPLPFKNLQTAVTAFKNGINSAAVAEHSDTVRTLSNVKRQSLMRQLDRYCSDISDLCRSVEQICQTLLVRSISLIFGASAASPRELITLSFPGSTNEMGVDIGNSTNRFESMSQMEKKAQLDSMQRKIVRELVGSCSDLQCSPSVACALFVAVTVIPAADTSAAISNQCIADPPYDGPGFSSLFAPRDGFRVPTVRGRVGPPPLAVALQSTTQTMNNGNPSAMDVSPTSDVVVDYIPGVGEEEWRVYVLKKGIRPLRKSASLAVIS